MIIYVNSIEIETKDIVQITDAENKFHGFVIHLIKDEAINIKEPERYDDYPQEKRNKNDRYRALRKKVEEHWQKDKTEFIILNL